MSLVHVAVAERNYRESGEREPQLAATPIEIRFRSAQGFAQGGLSARPACSHIRSYRPL